MRRLALVATFVASLLIVDASLISPPFARDAHADDAAAASAHETWIVDGDVPLPDAAKSVEILRDDEALSVFPGGARRALVAKGVRLPILGALDGVGCIGRWILVAPLAYVCADRVALSPLAAGVDDAIQPTPADGLPYKYYFAGKEGADVYAKESAIDDEDVAERLEKGWAIAGTGVVVHHGAQYVITRKNRLVPRAQLGAVGGFSFHGELLDRAAGDAPGVGWIVVDKAPVVADAKNGAATIGWRTRWQSVDVVESKKVGNAVFHRLREGGFVRERDARVPTATTPPDGVASSERWIDVDTATQTLVAYEGSRPVFATLVSTGRPWHPTPKGTFKIWVKLRSNTMSNADAPNADDTEEGALYSIEDVPWVQYFTNDGVALHGAFWHRSFGYPHSHGCVNLAPLDAMRLFGWTLPRVARGWDAAFPTLAEPATVVRVR